jgi:hypothetical protein
MLKPCGGSALTSVGEGLRDAHGPIVGARAAAAVARDALRIISRARSPPGPAQSVSCGARPRPRSGRPRARRAARAPQTSRPPSPAPRRRAQVVELDAAVRGVQARSIGPWQSRSSTSSGNTRCMCSMWKSSPAAITCTAARRCARSGPQSATLGRRGWSAAAPSRRPRTPREVDLDAVVERVLAARGSPTSGSRSRRARGPGRCRSHCGQSRARCIDAQELGHAGLVGEQDLDAAPQQARVDAVAHARPRWPGSSGGARPPARGTRPGW